MLLIVVVLIKMCELWIRRRTRKEYGGKKGIVNRGFLIQDIKDSNNNYGRVAWSLTKLEEKRVRVRNDCRRFNPNRFEEEQITLTQPIEEASDEYSFLEKL